MGQAPFVSLFHLDSSGSLKFGSRLGPAAKVISAVQPARSGHTELNSYGSKARACLRSQQHKDCQLTSHANRRTKQELLTLWGEQRTEWPASSKLYKGTPHSKYFFITQQCTWLTTGLFNFYQCTCIDVFFWVFLHFHLFASHMLSVCVSYTDILCM